MLFIMVSKSCQNCLKYLLIPFTALHTVYYTTLAYSDRDIRHQVGHHLTQLSFWTALPKIEMLDAANTLVIQQFRNVFCVSGKAVVGNLKVLDTGLW